MRDLDIDHTTYRTDSMKGPCNNSGLSSTNDINEFFREVVARNLKPSKYKHLISGC